MNWLRTLLGPQRTTAVVVVVALFVVVAIVGITVRACTPSQEAAQATQDVRAADATAAAAKDAVATVVAAGGREQGVDAVVEQATKEITNAPNPVAARAAVVRAVCGLRSYRSRPECAMQPANP